MKRFLKELKYNPPWEYIPAVIDFMQWNPYNRRTMYFWKWLRNCFYCTWQVR